MIKKILKTYCHKQQGFSLLETIAIVAISSFIATGIVISLHQMIFQGNNVREDMRSTQFVQNAGKWIREDILMSQAISSDDNPDTEEIETMTLCWVSASYKDTQDNDRIDNYEVSYFLDGQELRRKQYVITKVYNPTGGLIDTIEEEGVTLVSDNIASFTIIADNVELAFSISSLVGDAQDEKIYETLPRAPYTY